MGLPAASLQDSNLLFGTAELPQTEASAQDLSRLLLLHKVDPVDRLAELGQLSLPHEVLDFLFYHHTSSEGVYGTARTGWYGWGPGLIAGAWQTVLLCLLGGYCMNLMVGGGMLTYLLVREDDYWDDEDLADLDKLAKELEEEAKRDEAGSPQAAAAPAPSPAPPAPPAPPPAPTTPPAAT